jgi:Zn ribbon nucleic-acid-binding protein
MLNEKIIQVKSCKNCNSSFEITDKDLEFYEKVSPSFNGKKYLIPSPTFCPDCRQQRRLTFRNERKLYKRKCDAT